MQFFCLLNIFDKRLYKALSPWDIAKSRANRPFSLFRFNISNPCGKKGKANGLYRLCNLTAVNKLAIWYPCKHSMPSS